jgi:hypothetical protein
MSVASETSAQWTKLSRERGLEVPLLIMNDAARDQSLIAIYGIDNIKKLKVISEKYDTKQTFQTQQNGGFLLSRV